MSKRNAKPLALLLGLVIAASIQFVPRALSAKMALVKVNETRFFVIGTDDTVTATGVAWVGHSSTPTVMVPSGAISGTANYSFTGMTGMTPTRTQVSTFMNKKFTLAKSHALAAGTTKTFMTPGPAYPSSLFYPPAGPSVMGTTFMATGVVPPASPGFCFSRNPGTTTPATSPWTGACATHVGAAARVPGAKKYGGTARILRNSVNGGKSFVAPPFTTLLFIGRQGGAMPGGYSAMQTGPSAVGNYYHFNTASYTFLPGGLTVKADVHHFEMPFTTGMIQVGAAGFFYATSFARTGSFNLNGANATGMISLVKPIIINSYSRAGNFAGPPNAFIGGVRRLQLTFLGPPPGVPMMSPAGLVGLVAALGALGAAPLVVRRRRSRTRS